MKKNNKKTVIVFFSFAVGIALYIAFLILNNHDLIRKMGVIPYWEMILTRMEIITPDFYSKVTFLILGVTYFVLILIIGYIIITKRITNRTDRCS